MPIVPYLAPKQSPADEDPSGIPTVWDQKWFDDRMVAIKTLEPLLEEYSVMTGNTRLRPNYRRLTNDDILQLVRIYTAAIAQAPM